MDHIKNILKQSNNILIILYYKILRDLIINLIIGD